jgi:hypothetical protein
VTATPSSQLPAWAQPDAPRPPKPISPWRRAAGAGCLVLVVLLVPASVAGVWNPWRYVALRRYAGNPLLDAVVVALLAGLALWLLAPVRSEATQHKRVWLRLGAVAVFLGTLLCFGAFGSAFDPGKAQAVGRFGDLQAVVVTHGEQAEIRIWAGTGLGVRDMGRVGRACGTVSAFFTSRSEVQISTSYGDFRVPLDPATGRPLRQLGPRCTG